MAANLAFMKTLRRSEGAPKYNGAIVQKRSRRLTSVQEDDVFADENVGIKKTTKPNNGNRRRLSTRGSISEVEKPVEHKSPVKVSKALSFLKPIPQVNIPGDDFKVRNVPSPIPLPKGVTNIDPDDDSTQTYGREIFNYVLVRDAKFIVTAKDIRTDDDPKLEGRREHLVNWLITLAHSLKCSQETFYHTVDIVDRCLSKCKFKTEYLQLLGITAFLIASKLDEYHPIDPQELCRFTENSFDASKVRLMEQKVLTIINFEAYGTEPMTFIRRYLKAAQFWDDTIIYELSILFMDAMVLTLWEDAKDASTAKKAAVAVFTALLLDTMDTEDSQALEDIWTPNMRYYVWSDYNDLIPMTKCMLRVLKSLLRDTENDFGLTVKYKSVSRHHGLYQKLSLDRVFEVENFLKNY